MVVPKPLPSARCHVPPRPSAPLGAKLPPPSRLLQALLLLASLGCSGGGSNSIAEGTFGAVGVSGLTYETDTRSGTTSATGVFRYRPGESVRFYLGDVLLGEAPGASRITAFDLAGLSPLVGRDLALAVQDRTKGGLNQVLNLSLLLATLDADADRSNGIEISPDVATLYQDASLDVTEDRDAFAKRPGFRGPLNEANARNLFPGSTGPRYPQRAALAMEELYDVLGIEDEVFREALVEEDHDADGVLDEVRTRSYDAFGNQSSLTSDDNGDGILDETATWQYDPNGRLLIFFNDTDADGVLDSRTVFLRDAAGNLVLEERDTDGDGVVDRVLRMTYDENGARTSSTDDFDADGAANRIEVLQYDARGNRVRWQVDGNADGTTDRVELYRYDARNNRIGEDVDLDADGTPDRTVVFTFDEDDRRIREENDIDGDGAVDTVKTWEYDAQGNTVRVQGFSGPGMPLVMTDLFEYDARDNRTRFRRIAGDGSLQIEERSEYDSQGRKTRTEHDRDGDGQLDAIDTILYTADGARFAFDTNADGMADVLRTELYDDHGNVVRQELDVDADGTADSVTTRGFVSAGWGDLVRS